MSILGPLLFILFINDLPAAVQEYNVLMLADDTELFFADRDSGVIQNVLTTELENLKVWLMENKLSFNRENTETVLFGTNENLSKVANFELSIDDPVPLKRVTDCCYLGIILNANLSWHSHVDNIAVKVGRRIGMLRRLRNNLTLNAAEIVYKSFIRHFMEYGDSIWTYCGEQNKGRLADTPKACCYTVISRFPRSDDAMESLRWDSLESRTDSHALKLVRKCIGKCPQFFSNYFVFNRDISSRTT